MVATLAKLACAAVLSVSAVSAQAQELITNGDFETGLTGWTSYTTANGTIAEIPSLPGAPAPQSASVVAFDVTGAGSSNALFLNAGKYLPPYGAAPQEGGGVSQTFVTTVDGVATFSADVAAYYSRSSLSSGFGLMTVLLDGVVMDSYDFDQLLNGPVTLRGTLDFTTSLTAGEHTIALQATRFYAPGRGIASQYFDNVSFNLTAVPEPMAWGMMLGGFGAAGAMLRRRRVTVAIA